MAELRKLLNEEFEYKPWIYWLDFLASNLIAWGSFVAMQLLPFGSPVQVLLFLASVLFGYRAILFVHEISHFKQSSVPYFTFVWNILCGIPNFVPSFMYRGVHNDHHSKLFYGTKEDGEYVPFGAESPKRILLYVATTVASPLLLPLRFTVLAPVSLVIPSFRKIVVGQLSSLVIDFEYIRTELTPAEKRDWRWQEPLAFLWGASILTLILKGYLPATVLAYWYAQAFGIFFLNTIRTLAAHRYANRGEAISMHEQYMDSVNITGSPLATPLLCPVGLRFHALHHLFPTLPYHALGKAHRKLLQTLPADSSYHVANEPSISSAILHLWQSARNSALNPTKERTSLLPNFTQKRPNPEKHPE